MLAPTIDQAALAARMSAGSGLQGTNVVTPTDRFSWDEQLSELALLRLLQVIAHFEGWLEAIGGSLVKVNHLRSWLKDMTFPTSYGAAIASLGKSIGTSGLYAASKNHPYRIDPVLTDAVTCIRYFKEVRNCAIHRGRRASSAFLKAQADYEAVLHSGNLASVYRPPKPVLLGEQDEVVSVTHYAVIGVTGLIQRAIATLDGMLVRTAAGERYYLDRWRTVNPIRELPGQPKKRWELFQTMAGRIGPRPMNPVPQLEAILKREGLLRF